MKPEIDEEGFIVGVFNYCDRWCERCRFAMRCRVYDDISDENGNIRDLSMDETLEEVAGSFGKTFELLYKWAEEEGIDLNEVTEDSEDWERKRKIRDAKVDESPLAQATSAYGEMARQWLEENRSLFEQKLKELEQQVDLDIEPGKQVNRSGMLLRSFNFTCFQFISRPTELFQACLTKKIIGTILFKMIAMEAQK